MSKKAPLIDRLDAFLCGPHEDTAVSLDLILGFKDQSGFWRALTVGELGEAVHTAIRKVGDSNDAFNAHTSIRRMPPREWIEILQFAIDGLKIQNGIDDHG